MNLQETPPLPAYDTFCQGCHACAPTKQVSFYRNIGCIIMRFHQNIEGQLCRNCVNEHFSRMTLITSFLGWWGIISALFTPFILLNNIIRYIGCMSLKPADNQPARGTILASITLMIAIGFLALPVTILIAVINSPGPR